MKYYILYNPLAGHGDCNEKIEKIKSFLSDECIECDITKIENFGDFANKLDDDDVIVLSGGDGTVNRFANAIYSINLKNDILYYATGSGNDFLHDLGKTAQDAPFRINEYLEDLPTVEVKGVNYRFVNGVGYGIDGYCCEMGDKLKQMNKSVNYTTIAIKGLLFHYKPANATVIVDGVSHKFEKVWIAPTMNGRFYGGGMMPTPNQQRLGDGGLSVMIFHGTSKLGTLMIFPSLFKGEHVKHEKVVDIFEGREITVKFDKPTPLQIDGETILDVVEYTARAKKLAKV